MINMPKANQYTKDEVNHPEHYTHNGIETIDVIEAKLTREQFIGYLLGNIIKYSTRCNFKGSFDKDIGKASWYADRLKNFLDKKE